jgi:hypothetical protein
MAKNSKEAPIATTNKVTTADTTPDATKAPVAREPEVAVPGSASKPASKQQLLAALVVRDEGATIAQMIAATGWLPHTTRAALTGLKKKGYVISSDKIDGLRTYRAVAPQ